MDFDKVDEFFKKLKELRCAPRRCSKYHVQFQTTHNFYPTTNKYYNSDTGKSKQYEDNIIDDVNTFLEFIRNNQR